MTKIKVTHYDDIYVNADPDFRNTINVSVGDEFVELDANEARELVKALKKHIKKAEGN